MYTYAPGLRQRGQSLNDQNHRAARGQLDPAIGVIASLRGDPLIGRAWREMDWMQPIALVRLAGQIERLRLRRYVDQIEQLAEVGAARPAPSRWPTTTVAS